MSHNYILSLHHEEEQSLKIIEATNDSMVEKLEAEASALEADNAFTASAIGSWEVNTSNDGLTHWVDFYTPEGNEWGVMYVTKPEEGYWVGESD